MGAAHTHMRGRAIYWGGDNGTPNDNTAKDKRLSLC